LFCSSEFTPFLKLYSNFRLLMSSAEGQKRVRRVCVHPSELQDIPFKDLSGALMGFVPLLK
jgi:hypothetical protein